MRNAYIISRFELCGPTFVCLDHETALNIARQLVADGEDAERHVTACPMVEEYVTVADDGSTVVTTLSELERCARATIF